MPAHFLDENFLLSTETSRRLYHEIAAPLPIIDYHCHLPPQDIADDRRFANLHAIWLEGDHYKWRAMRANGIPERFCTGDAPPYKKFLAYARTVPMTLRNPLYHWTHLELQRYFDIHELLDEESAPAIWEKANSILAQPDFSVSGIFRRMRVEVVCTTDDPADSLAAHQAIAASGGPTRVLPTFRPDKAMQFASIPDWNAYVDRLGQVADTDIRTLNHFRAALQQRHDFFHQQGCRLSDHGLDFCPWEECDEARARHLFDQARAGQSLDATAQEQLATYILLFCGRLNAARGWVQQFHLGALRNNSQRQLAALGRDTGFDSIGDWPLVSKLGRFLDALDASDELAKTILYNLNPALNYPMVSMAGNFQDGSCPGKIQFGSGWWFLDQLEGMTWQMNALSQIGLLSRFVGMLTDSRSFLSYPRHEYFRRLLCDLMGRDAENGLLPQDDALLGRVIRGVCYENARDYFPFFQPSSDSRHQASN